MARKVYARMPSVPDQPFELAILKAGKWQPVDASHFSPRADDEVTILVPGTDVSLHAVLLPARTEREAQKAAPFAIEDELAEPVEDVHVALGRETRSGNQNLRELQACSRQKLVDWITLADQAGFRRAALVAEQSTLPDREMIVDAGSRILFAVGGKRFAVDASVGDDVLKALSGASPNSPEIYGAELAMRLGLDTWQQEARVSVMQLAAWAQEKAEITDLRRGIYTDRTSWQLTDLKAWRMPAALAAVSAVFWVLVTAYETSALNRQSQANLAKAQELYATAFPDEGIVSNPAGRIRERLAESSGPRNSMDFMTSSAALYQAIEAVSGTRIRSIRYERSNGEMRASLVYRNYGDDARIKSEIETAGFAARVGDTRQTSNGIIGELIIGGAS